MHDFLRGFQQLLDAAHEASPCRLQPGSPEFTCGTAPWRVCVTGGLHPLHRTPWIQPGCSPEPGPAPELGACRWPRPPTRLPQCPADDPPRRKTPPAACSPSWDLLLLHLPPPADSGRGRAGPPWAPPSRSETTRCTWRRRETTGSEPDSQRTFRLKWDHDLCFYLVGRSRFASAESTGWMSRCCGLDSRRWSSALMTVNDQTSLVRRNSTSVSEEETRRDGQSHRTHISSRNELQSNLTDFSSAAFIQLLHSDQVWYKSNKSLFHLWNKKQSRFFFFNQVKKKKFRPFFHV